MHDEMLCKQQHLVRYFASSYTCWHALQEATVREMLYERPHHDARHAHNRVILS